MKPRYSFSSRHTGQARDPKNFNKKRQEYLTLADKVIDSSDIVLQVLDARFIESTRNAEIEESIKKKGKVLIYVINKSDLRDKLEDLPTPYVIVSCKERKGVKQLRNKIKELASKIVKGGNVVVGVIGYPNTGKSSLINILIGKKSAGTGSEAGFTKGIQKLKLSENIVLLDSPGVIPKKEYTTTQLKLLFKHAKVGARSYSQIKNPEEIITELINEFPGVLESFYKIDAKGDSEILLDTLGKRRNMFKRGGEVNVDQVSRLIIKDWQEGSIRL